MLLAKVNSTAQLQTRGCFTLILGYKLCSLWLVCRTTMKTLFLYINLCLSVMLFYIHRRLRINFILWRQWAQYYKMEWRPLKFYYIIYFKTFNRLLPLLILHIYILAMTKDKTKLCFIYVCRMFVEWVWPDQGSNPPCPSLGKHDNNYATDAVIHVDELE